MAGLLRKRKGKEVASSSEGARFKTPYHEAHYNSKLSARKILPELIIQVDESILSPCAFQIQQRKWEKFTNPIQAVGHNMVKEFYANAWEPEKEKRKPYTYTTMVRGKEISFAPQDIKRVLKLRKDPLPNAASYEERVANKDYRLDHVQEDLCIEGGEWVRHKDGKPHYLRRTDLEPMTKGWYDFVCRSIMPTTNRSKLTVERAVLIHSIMIGENINVEEIIAKQFYKFIYKMDLSSSLPFPSIIAALCADAKIPSIKNDDLIPQEPAIVGEAMMRTRETRARNPTKEAPPQQPPPVQPQPQVHQQQDFPSSFYTHFDASMSQIYRRLDQQQEEKRQFREMEAQGIPVTIANLTIHRHREEEMNQERMRYDQILQEAAAQQAREANKGKTREVVPDSEEEEGSEELHSSASEECLVSLCVSIISVVLSLVSSVSLF
ncbi:hypothetical protein PIB30_037357 [Stylosanthes scabra]|uniref:Putative plant transposon protein domain-containing protein n=1 Tax=Stylosanthes scabra TaxID=79078 RepID=A0ABU6TFU1_9FABA|nr:hypothetical protein [Stylosanthes scabra]